MTRRSLLGCNKTLMSPEQIQLLRRLAWNDPEAVRVVMSNGSGETSSLEPRTEALVRIITLLSVDSDEATLRWAVDLGLAAGVEDIDIFSALLVVAPLIGSARLTSALGHLMNALELELLED